MAVIRGASSANRGNWLSGNEKNSHRFFVLRVPLGRKQKPGF